MTREASASNYIVQNRVVPQWISVTSGQGKSTSESEYNECCSTAVTAGNFILDKGCGVKADV